jgi:hypothetical protein
MSQQWPKFHHVGLARSVPGHPTEINGVMLTEHQSGEELLKDLNIVVLLEGHQW